MVFKISESLLHVLRLVAVLDGDLEHFDEPFKRVLVHRTDVSQTLFPTNVIFLQQFSFFFNTPLLVS